MYKNEEKIKAMDFKKGHSYQAEHFEFNGINYISIDRKTKSPIPRGDMQISILNEMSITHRYRDYIFRLKKTSET